MIVFYGYKLRARIAWRVAKFHHIFYIQNQNEILSI